MPQPLQTAVGAGVFKLFCRICNSRKFRFRRGFQTELSEVHFAPCESTRGLMRNSNMTIANKTLSSLLAPLLCALAVGCAGSEPKVENPTTPAPTAAASADVEPSAPTTEPAAAGHLVIAHVTVTGLPEVVELGADGSVVVGDDVVGMMHRDGRLVVANAVYRLDADGSIGGAEQFMRMKILPSGVITHGGRAQFSIDEEGNVRPIESGAALKLDGPRAAFQAAMFAVQILPLLAK